MYLTNLSTQNSYLELNKHKNFRKGFRDALVAVVALSHSSRIIGTRKLSNMPNGINKVMLKSSFRGCIMGGLLGDCLGAPFEGDPLSPGAKKIIQNYFDKLEEPNIKGPCKPYTDDTAMTKSVIKCLCDKPAVDFNCMARLFVQEYYKEPRRGYGANVVEVFHKLRATKFEDIYKPAKEQFGGSGSYGNGAAMRISPIGLYFYNNMDGLIKAAAKCAEITHANVLGVHGAILQCIAVRECAITPPNEKIQKHMFVDTLVEELRKFEEDDIVDDEGPYQRQLSILQDFLACSEEDRADEEIVKHLGTSVAALYSVPTAIYCFLRSLENIPGIQTDNIFRRTIQYAISLGGDTDTIASMAGSLAGAYLGFESINKNMQRNCEFHEEMLEMADNLFSNAVANHVAMESTSFD